MFRKNNHVPANRKVGLFFLFIMLQVNSAHAQETINEEQLLLNLYLAYEDSRSNQTKKISTIAGVYVGGGTDFDVSFSDNANGQMSFSIANYNHTCWDNPGISGIKTQTSGCVEI